MKIGFLLRRKKKIVQHSESEAIKKVRANTYEIWTRTSVVNTDDLKKRLDSLDFKIRQGGAVGRIAKLLTEKKRVSGLLSRCVFGA